MTEIISVVRSGRDWAVKHGAGFVGLARSKDQALQAAQSLVDWMERRGRSASLVEAEPRSFRNPDARARPPRGRHSPKPGETVCAPRP